MPVLNQARHIEECLQSICRQTLTEIEMIIVDGGSNDQTTEIVKRYEANDPRITLIDAPESCLSKARQAGLRVAKGEYILYLDGDDRLVEDALFLLYERGQEADAEMVVMNFTIDNRFNHSFTPCKSINFIRLSGIEFIRSLYERKNYWMVWSVLHKRSLYDNPISFDNSLYLGEDTLLTTQLAYYSRKVMKVNCKPLLFHSIHKAPTEKRKCMTQRKCFDLEIYPQLIRDFLKDKPEFELLEECWCGLRVESILRSFKYNYFEACKEKSNEALDILEKYPALRKKTGRGIESLFRTFSMSESLGKLLCRFMLQ